MTGSEQSKAPLEDIMVAMDVVDTLRHQQKIVERELDGEGRRERLLQRLSELYRAQGIEVPDHVIHEGIEALEQERFQYKPVKVSWRTRLSGLWVSRGRWGKPLGFLTVLGGLLGSVYVVTDVLPEHALKKDIPAQIDAQLAKLERTAQNPEILVEAKQQAEQAKQALLDEDLEAAEGIVGELKEVASLVQSAYQIRVVSRPKESSGVWRVPDVNEQQRNYYLIVEAIDSNNKVIALDVLSEESNTTKRMKKWGLRVNEETFYRVLRDKQDDGIIQSNKSRTQRRWLLDSYL